MKKKGLLLATCLFLVACGGSSEFSPTEDAGMQLANATLGAVGSKFNADAGNASADSKEIEKFIAWLQQQLDETSEELQALMDALTRCVSGLAAMIDSEAQTKDEIAGQMGMMV